VKGFNQVNAKNAEVLYTAMSIIHSGNLALEPNGHLFCHRSSSKQVASTLNLFIHAQLDL